MLAVEFPWSSDGANEQSRAPSSGLEKENHALTIEQAAANLALRTVPLLGLRML
jgi:hypothetical protein